MILLDSGTTTLTGGEDSLMSQAGPLAVAARLDLSDLTSGDTVVVRFGVELVEGGSVADESWEVVVGTTTNDSGAVIGVDVDTFKVPPQWFAILGTLTIEQTVGSPGDVKWEICQL